MNRPLTLLCVLLGAVSAGAAEYERRLIPVTVVLAPGAFNTRWLTRAWAVYQGAELVIVGPTQLGLADVYGRSQPLPLFALPTMNEPPGSIVYVPAAEADRVHIAARLALIDQAGGTVDETVLPVVRDREFLRRTGYFLGLQKREAERLHLRIYSLDLALAEAAVRVRVQATYPGTSWAFIYDEVHLLSVKQNFAMYQGTLFARRPLALQLDIGPILQSLPVGADIAVSVVPATPGLSIWAMLSETDNVTQRVRLALPQ